MKYYFVSDKNFDNQIINPRVPITIATHEDNITKRVCVSKSLLGIFHSIMDTTLKENKKVYVHTCDSNKAYQPLEKQVRDAYLTGEEWILEPIEMHLETIYRLTVTEIENKECIYYEQQN